MKPLHVLLVEDDEPLAASIATALRQVGWQVQATARGEQFAPTLLNEHFDVAILDINLPGIDGFEAMKRARQAGVMTPILVLTARDAVEDRVYGLEGGADDYLLKPFAVKELIARLRVLVRRHHRPTGHVLEHGPLRLDLDGHVASAGDQPLELSQRERAILELLIVNEGRVVGKDAIANALSDHATISVNAVEVYVFRLRAKVEPCGVRVRTVRGFGYMLDPWRVSAGAPAAASDR